METTYKALKSQTTEALFLISTITWDNDEGQAIITIFNDSRKAGSDPQINIEWEEDYDASSIPTLDTCGYRFKSNTLLKFEGPDGRGEEWNEFVEVDPESLISFGDLLDLENHDWIIQVIG